MTSALSRLFDELARRDPALRLPPSAKLEPGRLTQRRLAVPVARIRKLIPVVARKVADLPEGPSADVVWTRGDSELLVHTGTVGLALSRGLIRVSVTVECDQVSEPATITVPFAVGTEDKTTGLVMSTFDVVEGPTVIAEAWADPITAFCWECVLELARGLCAVVGNDASGKPLVPGSIAATRSTLLIQPMARHDVVVSAKG